VGKEKDFLTASSEHGKWQRRKVQHSKSKLKGPTPICPKELFQARIPTTQGDEVLAPSPSQGNLW